MAWHPFRNIGLKIAAIVLGIALWFTVSGQQVERKVPNVQVSYRNLPASLQITDQVDAVNVHVRGVESQITALQAGELVVEVDLRGTHEGATRMPLRIDQVKAPLGVEVTQIDPGAVPIVLERAGSAEIAVAPQIEGDPAPGYAVTGVTSVPAKVTAIGPERRLTASARAITDRVSIAGATDSVNAIVNVGIEDARLRLAQPTTARVTVQIEPTGMRTMTTRLELRNPASGRHAAADDDRISLTLRGANRVLADLEPSSVHAYVDLAGLGPGTHTLPVHVELDGRFAIAAITPATLSVRIR
jgi:YbbR domain-containing protein